MCGMNFGSENGMLQKVDIYGFRTKISRRHFKTKVRFRFKEIIVTAF